MSTPGRSFWNLSTSKVNRVILVCVFRKVSLCIWRLPLRESLFVGVSEDWSPSKCLRENPIEAKPKFSHEHAIPSPSHHSTPFLWYLVQSAYQDQNQTGEHGCCIQFVSNSASPYSGLKEGKMLAFVFIPHWSFFHCVTSLWLDCVETMYILGLHRTRRWSAPTNSLAFSSLVTYCTCMAFNKHGDKASLWLK